VQKVKPDLIFMVIRMTNIVGFEAPEEFCDGINHIDTIYA
jgi:DNA-binding LytR/AlgR family response regulator